MNTQVYRKLEQFEEDMYPVSVALGRAASTTLRIRPVWEVMRNLPRLAQETVKWSDILDYFKKEMARYLAFRVSLAAADVHEVLTPYYQSGDSFGALFLHVAEQHFLPSFTAYVKDLGFDLESQDHEQAQQAHTYILRLFRKMISQMVTEYEYQRSLGVLGNRN